MSQQQVAINWVPFVGEFDFNSGEIVFRGKLVPGVEQPGNPPTGPKPGVGLALTDRTIADGKIAAEVLFKKVTPETLFELALSSDPNGSHLIAAGLGGDSWAMFGIREFNGPKAKDLWFSYRSSGDRANLKADRWYRLEMIIRGASISLNIDGVPVAAVEVTSPMIRQRQVGLFCRADDQILVRNLTITGAKPKAFVVMQFGPQFDDVYNDVVKEVAQSYDILRADEVSGPGLIIEDIVRELAASQLVIADITPPNPNVFFEVGYALALVKPTILLAKKGTALPFDVAGFRTLFYEDTIGGKKKLEEGLKKHLDALRSA